MWKCIIPLPPRNDVVAQTECEWHLDVREDWDFDGQSFLFPEGIEVSAEAQWLDVSVLSVTMVMRAPVLGSCCRCLQEAQFAINERLLYIYHLRGVDFESENEDSRFNLRFMPVVVEHFAQTLDLEPEILESIFLLLPMKLLCKEECLGLCAECGANRNFDECVCKELAVDPRFEVLRSLST